MGRRRVIQHRHWARICDRHCPQVCLSLNLNLQSQPAAGPPLTEWGAPDDFMGVGCPPGRNVLALCARQCDAACQCAGQRGNSLELGRHRQLRRQLEVPRAAIKPCIKHVLNSQLLRTPGVSIEECHAPALSATAEAQHIFCPTLGIFRSWLLRDDLLDLPDERGPQWRRTQ
jgi:hypothetical protein